MRLQMVKLTILWNRWRRIFISMDKMIGKDFEKGLSQLKAEAEK